MVVVLRLEDAQALLQVDLPHPRSRGQSRSRRVVGAGRLLHQDAGTRVETVTLKRKCSGNAH